MTERTQGISGTEIAGLFGMSPYCTRFSIYAKKKGLVPDEPPNQRMRIGKLQEPVVVQLFEEETGKKIDWTDELIEHPKEPLIIGTPDGYVYEHDAGFEAKTAGLDRAFEWGDSGDRIPVHYLMQCQYYSLLTGLPMWHLGALIGGNDFRRFEIKKDEELQAMMLDEVRKFWRDHIEKDVAPEIDYSDAARSYLLARYPSPTEGIRTATADEDELVIGVLRTRKELKFLEQRKEQLQNQLKDSIGFAKGITSIHGKVSWSVTPEVTVASFVRKAGRTLRITGKREASDE